MTFVVKFLVAMRRLIPLVLLLACTGAVQAAGTAAQALATPAYLIQPGDILTIIVWKEKELQSEVLVRPDGALSFPLIGDVAGLGRSVEAVRQEITDRLQPFIPSPVVTVAIKAIGGNRIYVLGKVNRPGDFPFSQPVDVMQALSLAGGATPYAALNDVVILRRQDGAQKALRFRYGDVEHGKYLEQNILLQSGDTVVVP